MLDYEPEQPREIEPLMGWTTSGDMRQQVRLRFETKEEAVAYCERHGIAYQVFETPPAEAPAHFLFGQFRLSRAATPGRTERRWRSSRLRPPCSATARRGGLLLALRPRAGAAAR